MSVSRGPAGPLASTLKRLRLAANLSQERLAQEAGVSTRAVSDLERGVHPRARTGTLDALGRVLGSGALAQLRLANRRVARSTDLVPTLAARPDEAPFVGRTADLDLLRDAWDVARAGHTVVADVIGDPGIGKSRLVRTFATALAEAGHPCLAGQCDDGPADPYRPFVEALATGGLARGADGLDALFLESPRPTRWDRFETIRSWLSEVTAEEPILLVLEDLHWAQPSDLLLLRHLARPPGCGPMLVVVTHRPGHAECERALFLLARDATVRTLPLDGLDAGAVADLATRTVGTPEPRWAEELRRHTDGNPWAIVEVLRAVAAQDGPLVERLETVLRSDQLALVAGHVVAEHLSRLPAATLELVEVGSVLGREVDLEVVAGAAGRSEGEVVALAHPAVDARVWRERSVQGGWTFTHDLVQDVVYTSLGANRRAVLHRAVADAIEATTAPPAVRARHRLAGLPAGGRAQAVAAALDAAQRAVAGRAWDEAAQFWSAAAAALDADPDRAHDRLDALLAGGDAQLRALARQDARPLFREAASLAVALHDQDALRRAARGYAHMTKVGAPDPSAQALWTAVLAEEPPPDLRAVVLGALAIDHNLVGDHAGALAASAEALEVGWRSDEPDVSSMVLATRSLCLWGTAHPVTRVELAEALLSVGHGAGRNDIVLDGLELLGVPQLELGDVDGFTATRDRLEQLGEREERRLSVAQAHQWSALLHLLHGEYDRAQDEADRAVQLAADAPNFSTGHAAQTYAIFRAAGRGDELCDALRAMVERHPGPTPWQAMLALADAESGRDEAARAGLRAVAADAFSRVRRDWSRVATLALAAAAAALLGESGIIDALLPELAPFAGTLVVVASGTSCEGAVDRYLARCATAVGDVDIARRRLEDASALEDRIGAVDLAARSRRDLELLD